MKPTRAWPDEHRLERWARGVREWALRLAFRAFPQLAVSALEMESAALSSPGIPHLFPRDLREIPPNLNEDLLDLYGRSEQVLANTFAFLNRSQTLAPDFDWDTHESPVWRRELHAFDYALDLAMTYFISQEDRYTLHLRYLIAHWVAANPPGLTFGWDLEPLARRVHNWILSSDLGRQVWMRDPEFLDLFGRSLAMQCVYLEGLSGREASPEVASRAARALLLAGKYFAGARADQFTEAGRALLRQAFASVLKEEENAIRLRPSALLGVAEACIENLVFASSADEAERASGADTAQWALELLEGVLMPDGTLPMLGPSARACTDEISDLFAIAATLLGEPRWKKLAGKFGIVPCLLLGNDGQEAFERLPKEDWHAESRMTPELGLTRLASSRRSALMINARPVASRRDHQDFLSYELTCDGWRVIADSGAFSPSGETWDPYFAGARAHNLFLLDGHPPRPEHARHGKPPADGWILGEDSRGVCFRDDSWNFLGVCHRRAFYALEESVWAVLDLLEGKGTHQIRNLIHFYPTFEVEVRGEEAVARSRAMSVTILPLGPSETVGQSPISLKASRGHHADLPAFYSPDFGVRFEATVLAFEISGVLLPWLGGYLVAAGDPSGLRVTSVSPREGSIELEISGKRHKLTAR